MRSLLLCLALLSLLTSCGPQPTRPNIILIMTDDQPAELTAAMPNVQRLLADEGVTFSSAFATTSLCCPARTTTLRGQYVHNHGVLSNGGPQGGFPKVFQSGLEASTLATWLRSAGYRTALMGKYLNAYPYGPAGDDPANYQSPWRGYVPPGWSEWFGFFDVPRDPFNTPYGMYDYRVNDNGRSVRYGSRPSDYQTDVLSEKAQSFIRRGNGKPFFLFLAPTAPHLPAVVAERHQDKLLGLRVPRSPAFNEADTSDKPRWVRNVPPLNAAQIAEEDNIYHKQAEMLLAVDDMLGAITETLEEKGELQNTYIIFTADQGFHAGEHRLMKMKLTPYAASVQVPLLIRGPGIPHSQTRDQLVLNTDLAPTIADLAGVQPPAFVDGRSLKPLWSGAAPPWRQTALLEFWPRRSIEDYGLEHLNPLVEVPKYRAVRSKRHLFVEYSYQDGTQEGELYDLGADPFELTNLYKRTDPKLLAVFSAHAARLQACAAASCRKAENASPSGL